MWEFQSRISGKNMQTLGTSITLSNNIVAEIEGENMTIVMSDSDSGSDGVARHMMGVGHAVTGTLAFHQGSSVEFCPEHLKFRNEDGSIEDHSDAIDRLQEGFNLDLATGSDQTVEKVDGDFPSRETLELSIEHGQLALALAYRNRGVGEHDGGKALVEFFKAQEAIQKHGDGGMCQNLGFTKKEWDKIGYSALPFRHVLEDSEEIPPIPDPKKVAEIKELLERIITAFVEYLRLPNP